jgi:hypothetical protein
VAFGFLYVQSNPRLFLGSVLESINPESARGDISYLTDTGVLYVFAKQSVKGDLSLDIRFDADNVSIDPSTYTSLYDGEISALWSGLLRVERKNIAISGRDPIVTMPFVSADPNILVSDASVAGQPLIIERL